MGDRAIIEAIEKLSGNQLSDRVSIAACTVNSVDVESRTCNCTEITGQAGIEIPNVQIQPEVCDGILLVPSVGSTVLVTYSKYNPPFVSMFSDIDRVFIVAGNAGLNISEDTVVLNDGSFGGLVKVADLISKLNNLENLVNDLITKYNLHTHPVSGANTLIPAVIETGSLTPTLQDELENKKVTHGIEL
jgi:hypothetical protein